jgi:hypothetical protein
MTQFQFVDDPRANALIAIFLAETPNPSRADWKRLIDQNKAYAAAITDAALLYAGSQHVTDEVDDSQLTETVFNATVSATLNKVFQEPGPLLKLAEQKVAEIQGPRAKVVAQEIDLGSNGPLLSGVLVGRTVAPSRVLNALAKKLEVSAVALAEFFRRSFELNEVPAYKATNGKPQVSAKPATWEEAVTSLKLSPEETRRLLDFDDRR